MEAVFDVRHKSDDFLCSDVIAAICPTYLQTHSSARSPTRILAGKDSGHFIFIYILTTVFLHHMEQLVGRQKVEHRTR